MYNELITSMSTFHRIEKDILIIAGALAVLCLLGYAAILYVRAKNKELAMTFKNANKIEPSCADTCANYDGECAERETECTYYEPKKEHATKIFNPSTGEVITLNDSPCADCDYRLADDCRNGFRGSYDKDEYPPFACHEVKRCVFKQERKTK